MTGIPLTTIRNASDAEHAAYHDEAQVAADERAFTRDMLALNAELSHAILRAFGAKGKPLKITRPGQEPEPDSGGEPVSMAEFARRIKAGEI